jgi:hypothetical protein
MKKFQLNKETGDFEIDPKHLVTGLTEAAKKKHTAIRITALDYREEELAFDAAELSHQKWIKSLTLDDDLVFAATSAPTSFRVGWFGPGSEMWNIHTSMLRSAPANRDAQRDLLRQRRCLD